MSKKLKLVDKSSLVEHSDLIRDHLLKVKSGFDTLEDEGFVTGVCSFTRYLNEVLRLFEGYIDVSVGLRLYNILASARQNLTEDEYEKLCNDTVNYVSWLLRNVKDEGVLL